MKKNLEILLIALCLITNYFIKNYLSFIALFFLIILYLFDENRENFKKVLIKLEVINQIYISKEEKLNNYYNKAQIDRKFSEIGSGSASETNSNNYIISKHKPFEEITSKLENGLLYVMIKYEKPENTGNITTIEIQ